MPVLNYTAVIEVSVNKVYLRIYLIMSRNSFRIELEHAVNMPSARNRPLLYTTRRYYSNIATKVLQFHPSYRVADVSALGFNRREIRTLPAAMDWAYDVLGFTALEKKQCMNVVCGKPMMQACCMKVPLQTRPRRATWALTAAQVQHLLKLNAAVYNSGSVTHATCLVVYFLFVYGIRLVDLLNMMVDDVVCSRSGISVTYWSYKNRTSLQHRSILSLDVHESDTIGFSWLYNMVEYARAEHMGGRIFHGCTSFVDDYALGIEDHKRLYQYFYSYLKWLFRQLGVNPSGGTHCGRRSLFTNCSDEIVSRLAQQLGIEESTARSRYRKPSLSSSGELFKIMHGSSAGYGMRPMKVKLKTSLGDDVFAWDLTPTVLATLPNLPPGTLPLEAADDTNRAADDTGRTSIENAPVVFDSSDSDDTRLEKELRFGFHKIDEIVSSGVFVDGKTRRVFIRCRWEGYGPADDTWEPATALGRLHEHLAFTAWRRLGYPQNGDLTDASLVPADRRGRALKKVDGLDGFCLCCSVECSTGTICSTCCQSPESYSKLEPLGLMKRDRGPMSDLTRKRIRK